MPLDIDNEALIIPPDDTKLWRYMDIPAFIFLISKQQLTFARADLFEDRFEGIIPEGTAAAMNIWANTEIKEGRLKSGMGYENLSELLNTVNKKAYISCWCKENHEMVHMWKIYSKPNGVCIETTYKDLIDSCDLEDESIVATEVKYVDFKNHVYSYNGNPISVFTMKRKEYKSESEFRLIMRTNKSTSDYLGTLLHDHEFRNKEEIRIYNSTPVLYCNVNTKQLIHKIHLSPYAPAWYIDVITNLINAFNLSGKQILRSEL